MYLLEERKVQPAEHPLLFDIETDPSEQHELDLDEYATVVDRLQREFDAYKASLEPRAPLLDQFNLFSAPCCSPFPLLEPCNCSARVDAAPAMECAGEHVYARQPAYAYPLAKTADSAETVRAFVERKYHSSSSSSSDGGADVFSTEDLITALQSLKQSPVVDALTHVFRTHTMHLRGQDETKQEEA